MLHARAHFLLDSSGSQDRSVRKVVLRDSTMRDGENNPIDVLVTDLSTTGFSVDAPLNMAVGAVVRLGLGGAGTASARIVRRTESTYGCQFLQPLHQSRVEAAFQYNEVLASIDVLSDVGGNVDMVRGTDYWPLSTRVGVMLVCAGGAWAVLFGAWFSL